jgi:hypothetical protein
MGIVPVPQSPADLPLRHYWLLALSKSIRWAYHYADAYEPGEATGAQVYVYKPQQEPAPEREGS